MRWFYRQKIGARLGCGFGIILVLILLLGGVALMAMKSLSELTRNLYEHPLTVSNAIRDARGQVLSIHQLMKDAILSQSEQQLQEVIGQIDREDKEALRCFDVLRERFLGDKDDVEAAYREFLKWKTVRTEIFDLVRSGNKEKAMEIDWGRDDQQIMRINQRLEVIRNFAQQKAESFFSQARKSEQTHFWIMSGLLLLISAAGAMGAAIVTRSITGPLRQVVEQINVVAGGNLDHKINLDRADEIGVLARAFDAMTASLKKITASRNELDAANQQLGASEQQLRASNQQLRASEQYRESLITSVPGVVFQLHMNANGAFSINYMSRQAETIIGHPMSILTQSDCFFDIIHPNDTEHFKQSIRESARTQDCWESEFRIFDKNGRLTWLKGKAVPQRLADAGTLWNGIIIDITDRKLDEAKLVESEARYRIVADNTYDWEFWMDPDGQYLYLSPSCLRITGYTAEQFKTDPGLLKAILHPDDKLSYQSHVVECRTEKKRDTFNFRIINKDGQVLWIEHLCQPIYDKDGKWLGIRGSNRDITDRKRTEESLQKTNDLLQAIINAVPVAVIGLDLDGKVCVVWNPAAEKMLGWSAAEVMGKYLPSVPVDKEEEFQKFRNLIRSGRSLDGIEVRRQKKDGLPIDYSIYSSPIHDSAGQITGNIAVLVDITERKKAQAAIIEGEARFRTIISNTPDHVIIQDRDLRYTFVLNPQLGMGEADILGKTDFDFLTAEDAEKLAVVKRQVLEKGQTIPCSASLKNRHGQEEFFEGTFVPKFGINGEVDGLIGYFRNATERKQIEEKMKQSEEKFMKAFHLNPASMSISTVEEGRFLDVNEQFLQYLGCRREEVIGRTSLELNLFTDYSQRTEFIRILKEKGTVRDCEATFRRRTGEILYGQISADIIELQNTRYLLVMVKDVTDRKLAEAKIQQQLFELQRWHDITLGREGRVLELKEEVNGLLEKLGQSPRYSLHLEAIDSFTGTMPMEQK